MKSLTQAAFLLIFFSQLAGQTIKKEFVIDRQYLNIPVEMGQTRQKVKFVTGKDTLLTAVMRIADVKTDYWVFKDVSQFKGKKLVMVFSRRTGGIDKIYQSDKIAGQDSLYLEKNRPGFHFTTRRGWINDPNGLVYNNGEYHLFYQHNPFETQWENMHWGHAVGKDLLHWTELNDALYPDSLGTMFSGSAVIDHDNTAGWGKGTLVALYTAAGAKMTQNVAYSHDNGRTFTKYKGNPVLGPNRDPKVFWYAPESVWVMVLYNENYFAIYNSKDLRNWEFKSRVKGFYECPELFELAVDGDEKNKKWVMYGASGSYMIGSFDGREFIPGSGKYYYTWGSLYAAQTFNNINDGRRIQIGWGRIEQPGMPFNQMMLFPAELTLRSTADGIRLFCEPVKEIMDLHDKEYRWTDLTGKEINEKLKEVNGDLFHITMDVEIESSLNFNVRFRGNDLVSYDAGISRINNIPYTCDPAGSLRFSIEILIDRTSVETYVGKGKLFFSEGLKPGKSKDGLQLSGSLKVHSLEISTVKSIW